MAECQFCQGPLAGVDAERRITICRVCAPPPYRCSQCDTVQSEWPDRCPECGEELGRYDITRAVADDLAHGEDKTEIAKWLVADEGWPEEAAAEFVNRVERERHAHPPQSQGESGSCNSDFAELTWGELQTVRMRLMGRLSWRLMVAGLMVSFAATMVYWAIYKDLLFIIGVVIYVPLAVGFADRFIFTEEGVRSLVLDMGAKPITKETRVSSNRKDSFEGGADYYMRFASLSSGEFQVSKREFERFYRGNRVLVSYYPRSKTVAKIRGATAHR